MIVLRRLAPLLLLLGSAAAVAAADIPGPLTDPATGDRVELDSAPLTHLVFFATWCPPCLEQFSGLRDMEARWQDDGYRLVLVAVPTRHTAERLRDFIGSRQPPGRVVFDATGDVTAALAVRDLPTHILLDSSGKELARAGAPEDGIVQKVREVLRR